MQLDVFIFQLRKYAAGDTSMADFQRLIDYVVTEGPSISRDQDGELSAEFPIAVESAMYLDMVNDPDSPGFDPEEARHLANSLANLASQVPSETAGLLAPFARWSRKTTERIRAHLSGAHSRNAFEDFISRRPWPDSHKAAIKQLPRERLTMFAEGLERDDFGLVASAIAYDIADD
jgi:hypothetical protein